jgi:hypothetical protein
MTQYWIPEQVVPGKRLGRHCNHDPQSLRYPVGTSARAITSVEHQRVIPVLDQGNLGSCTGNAAVGALGTKPLYDTLSDAQKKLLTESYAVDLYEQETREDPYDGSYPPDDTGSDGLTAAKVCKSRGFISGYTHATSLTAMQAALQDAPVIIGINWYEGFDHPDPDTGIVQIAGSIRGGHEVEVIGWDATRQLFHAVNSWSKEWGLNGHFWIPVTVQDRLLDEDGDCTQLLPLNVPAPVPTPTPLDQASRDLITAMDPWANQKIHWLPTGKAGTAREGYFKWKQANGV